MPSENNLVQLMFFRAFVFYTIIDIPYLSIENDITINISIYFTAKSVKLY